MGKREKSLFREYFELIAETAVFVFFVVTFVVQAFRIPSGSMIPKLLIGDFVLVNKMIYARPVLPLEGLIWPEKPLARKDIIVFKWPGDLTKDYVKRVIGLPGEKVEIRARRLYVNDQLVDEPYTIYVNAPPSELSSRDNYGPIYVPPDSLFVLGDNRDDSADSRTWGYVPLANIKGRPWLIYYSYEAQRQSSAPVSFGDRLKALPNFLLKARWGRLLKVID